MPRGSDAEALIVGWPAIRDVAGQHALRKQPFGLHCVFDESTVRKRRDRQLGQGVAAADRAIASLRKVLEIVGKHSETIDAEDDFKAYWLIRGLDRYGHQSFGSD